MPDFGLLHVRAHKTDPRAATSIVMACMTLSLALMVTLSLTPPVRPASPKSAGQVAPPPAAGKVTIVAATPRLDVPCAEQTWPYIDQRCLTESTQKRPEPEWRREAATAPVDPSKATPPVASAVTASPAPAETQGVAPAKSAAAEPQHSVIIDTSEEAELAEDEDLPHPIPDLSPQEQRRLERFERSRAAQERRTRHPHFQLPLFGRIF
ncbi:MAG TPA: hypothetical protein VJL90_13880 [Pseudorhodoplanes sp.]|nr:hypothetical protein [Pseudorhodoplanes sp.]